MLTLGKVPYAMTLACGWHKYNQIEWMEEARWLEEYTNDLFPPSMVPLNFVDALLSDSTKFLSTHCAHRQF